MREIVLDTETTGLDPSKGHRVVEIGAVEISNLIPTGRTFHVYIDPERDMPEEAFRVHGLSRGFLAEHKKFAEIVHSFREFVDGARLIIHNAEFDVRFLNAELARLDFQLIEMANIIARPRTRPSTRWPSPAVVTPALPTRSTRCASVMESTHRGAKSTEPCSTLICWRKSTRS